MSSAADTPPPHAPQPVQGIKKASFERNCLIRCMSQKHLPQPFWLSLSKPGCSLLAALRQAQGERGCLRYVANQEKLPDQVHVSDISSSTVRAELVEARALLAGSPSTSSGRTGLSEICRQSGKNSSKRRCNMRQQLSNKEQMHGHAAPSTAPVSPRL